MSETREKWLVVLLCVIGISATAYGMAAQNHPVFILGLVFIIAGYLLIRRKLKASMKDDSKRP